MDPGLRNKDLSDSNLQDKIKGERLGGTHEVEENREKLGLSDHSVSP